MKKFLCFALCALFCATLSVAAFAARDTSVETEYATALRSLGLFRGVSENNLDLDRAPTRVEALVMLIRTLGKEADALAEKNPHPFDDVPAWADDYVGYAYANGLTKGSSPAKFGMGDATAANYLTFMLRALGYSDADGDFSWDDPFVLAKSVGILPEDVDLWHFWRADAAAVSYAALTANLKGSNNNLAWKLIGDGVFTGEAFDAAWRGVVQPGVLSDAYTPVYPYGFDYTASPASTYLRLGAYKGLKTLQTIEEITDGDMIAFVAENSIEGLPLVEVARAAANGDTVDIDYVGRENGEAFAGGTGRAEALLLGSGAMIPGFEEGIVGMKAGETKTFPVTFPENYYPNLAGHTVEFTITLHKVSGYTEEALAAVKNALYEERRATAIEQAGSDLLGQATEGALLFAYPCGAVEDYLYETVRYATEYAALYGLSYTDFVPLATGDTVAAYEAGARTAIKQSLREELTVYAIAEAEGITVEEEEIDRAYNTALVAGVDFSGFGGDEAYIRFLLGRNLLYGKVTDFLVQESNFALFDRVNGTYTVYDKTNIQ